MAKNSTDKILVGSILFAAVAISGSLIFFGMQMNGGGGKNLESAIQDGIEQYVLDQQNGQNQETTPKIVKGDHSDDDPVFGEDDAELTIVEFSDYQCPLCRVFYNDTLPKIKEKYVDTGKVKLVFRDYPLSFHPDALPAAMAANCARAQGDDETYFKMHDMIFDGQNLLGANTVEIPRASLSQYAGKLGLNVTTFDSCVDKSEFMAEITKDAADGDTIGVGGTPSFIVGEQFIEGAMPFEAFEAAIEAQL